MKNKDIVVQLYHNNQLLNKEYFKDILDENVVFEWHSSIGTLNYSRLDLLGVSEEISLNYINNSFDVKYIVAENNSVCVAYHHFASNIENPKAIILLGKFICIWEFNDEHKIIKGYQISQPS